MTAIADELDAAKNVLMLSPSMSPKAGDVHHDLLARQSISKENVLVLTFQRPRRWLRRWSAQASDRPNELGIISLNETWTAPPRSSEDVTVVSEKPTDLTGVGISVTDFLKRWDDADEQTVVCFDSVTELLQFADRATIYRFLRIVTRRFDAIDAFAHFHMDPDAHDPETVATLKPPFDAVVDATARDGDEVAVMTRY